MELFSYEKINELGVSMEKFMEEFKEMLTVYEKREIHFSEPYDNNKRYGRLKLNVKVSSKFNNEEKQGKLNEINTFIWVGDFIEFIVNPFNSELFYISDYKYNLYYFLTECHCSGFGINKGLLLKDLFYNIATGENSSNNCNHGMVICPTEVFCSDGKLTFEFRIQEFQDSYFYKGEEIYDKEYLSRNIEEYNYNY